MKTLGRIRTALACGLAALAFLLVLPLNALTWWMSLPALFLAGSYPFTKRFLAIPVCNGYYNRRDVFLTAA